MYEQVLFICFEINMDALVCDGYSSVSTIETSSNDYVHNQIVIIIPQTMENFIWSRKMHEDEFQGWSGFGSMPLQIMLFFFV